MARAVATLLDFLTAMVVVIGAVSVYFTASAILVDVQDRSDASAERVGLRAEERLVEDVFRNHTGDDLLTPGCVRDFFAASGNRSCGFRDRGSGQSFLRGVLGVGEAYELNVTVERDDEIVETAHRTGRAPYRHAIGERVPVEGDVALYTRLVSFGPEAGDDSTYYTVVFRVWEVA